MLCILFLSPFGACYVIAFTRGFTLISAKLFLIFLAWIPITNIEQGIMNVEG